MAVILLFSTSRKSAITSNSDRIRAGEKQQQKQSSHSLNQYDDGNNSNNNNSDNNNDGEDENDSDAIAASVETVKTELEEFEEVELKNSETILWSAIETAGDYMRKSLMKIFGSEEEAEVNAIVKEVEENLRTQAHETLSNDASAIIGNQEEKLDELVEEDDEQGVGVVGIQQDVQSFETEAMSDLKHKLDEDTKHIRERLEHDALLAEKKVLEERLSLRLGKKVELKILDDDISGVDELLAGLPRLGGSPSQQQQKEHFQAESSTSADASGEDDESKDEEGDEW